MFYQDKNQTLIFSALIHPDILWDYQQGMLDLLRGNDEFESHDAEGGYLEETHSAGWFERFYLLLPTKWRCLGFCISRSSAYLSESFREGFRNKFFSKLFALG
ncbi:hypothetical protein DZA29_00585 [Citrobacter gillenii]|nr:hypothetical protein DZA29_00585 [Citrobacter gillenii]